MPYPNIAMQDNLGTITHFVGKWQAAVAEDVWDQNPQDRSWRSEI